jgi:acetolactate synthase-1/2/3 large subunit
MMARRAAGLLVDCLRAQGADRIFCVPGESYLTLLDALYDAPEIQVVTCRHESGAGFMAVADAKITGRPGLCAVSRGPGATNVSIAIHTAEQDAVPLVVLIGQVARRDRGRGAFQEVDYGKTFSDMAKGVWEVSEADRLPEVVARAFHVAESDTPGPVVLVLPEDMLSDATSAEVVPRLPAAMAAPGPEDLEAVLELLDRSERPLLIAGGRLGAPAGRKALLKVAEARDLAVALSFKRQDHFPNDHPNFAGYLGFKVPRGVIAALGEADLILAVGTRLTDVTTQGYLLPRAPVPDQPLVHVYPDPSRIGGVYRTTLGLPVDPVAFLRHLAERPAAPATRRRDWVAALHGQARDLAAYTPLPTTDGVNFGAVVHALGARAAPDAVIVMDAGNFSSWVHRHWPWRTDNLIVGTVGGAMGLGIPGAVAAALRLPGRQILSFVGDGGMLMTGGELATAMQQGLPLKVFVSNNRSYGTIRLHQERDYPGRVSATELTNPDFAQLARAFGATGLVVETESDIENAVAAALAADGPVVVDVRASLEAISAYTTITQLHGAASRPKASK